MHSHDSGLPRSLRLGDSISIVAGIIIGAGIFLVPSLVAARLPSPGMIIAVWVFGGALSFLGALGLAELGAMMPATGGQYVFLREAYGPMIAFLCGWTSFLTAQSAAVAWLGMSFVIQLHYFMPVPLNPWASKALGIVVIGLIAAANYRGVRIGSGVQNIFTAAKLVGLAVLIGSAFLAPSRPVVAQSAVSGISLGAFGAALIACLLSYDGWACVSSVAGEIREPQKNVLRALAGGVAICILIYTTVNFAYLRVFTLSEFAASARIGAALGERTLGGFGGTLVTVTIMISIVGALNGWLLTQPRVYFAQARDGLFFRRFGEIHPRYRTPGFAIAMQFVWSAVLLLTGSFEILISFAMFSIWVFYALSVAAVIVLRRKRPELARPYRMWGYPVTPLIFVAVAAWFVVNTLVESPGPSLTAFAIMLAGVPVYFLWRRLGLGAETPVEAVAIR